MASLCSAQLMSVFREVSGTPRALVASSAHIPSPNALGELRSELRTAGVPEEAKNSPKNVENGRGAKSGA